MNEAIENAELDAEFDAMRKIDAALRSINDEARGRVLRWACRKHGVALVCTANCENRQTED